MQTKQQIQQLLESAGIKPNKRFGQHFLIDLNLMRLLTDSANIQKKDIVLEVGCGTGSLTEILAEKAGRVIAVEFDGKLFEIAQKQLEKIENIDFINSDILENKKTIKHTVTNLIRQACERFSGRLLLVANLTYNIASPLILNFITGPIVAEAMYVTVQKEVADRMTAAPNSKDYGIVSIFLASTGNIKTLRRLKPAVFWPKPQVDSAMVSFVRDTEKAGRIVNMDLFCEIVSLFMGYRRKTMLTCSKLARGRLAQIHNWSEIFEKCSINPTHRPDQISPKAYIDLAQYAEKNHFFY